MDTRLIIEGLAKRYPGRPVFSGISAVIDRGRKLVIAGPNGSGKSTLLRIICGFVRPSRGRVWFERENSELTRTEIRPYVGLVSPDLVLYDELTAFENLSFFAGLAGERPSEQELSSRLSGVGLEGRGHDLVSSYSSGMKQRLKYCLALLRNPEILLLDEPTANLDEAGKALAAETIRSFEGILVMATNEKSELEYGDEIIRLGE
jgi:heme exporter protein A